MVASISAPALHPQRTAVSSQLTIRFWSCRPSAATDKVSIVEDPSGKVLVDAKMRREPAGDEIYATALPSGHYTIVAGVLPCSASRNVAILPGKDRSVAMRGRDQLVMDADLGALAGALPVGVVRVIADCVGWDKQTVRYVALIQNGAYYFDSIRAPAACNVRAFPESSGNAAAFRASVAPFKALRRDVTLP